MNNIWQLMQSEHWQQWTWVAPLWGLVLVQAMTEILVHRELWHFVLLFPGQAHEGSWSPSDKVTIQISSLEPGQGSRYVKVLLEQSLNPHKWSQWCIQWEWTMHDQTSSRGMSTGHIHNHPSANQSSALHVNGNSKYFPNITPFIH